MHRQATILYFYMNSKGFFFPSNEFLKVYSNKITNGLNFATNIIKIKYEPKYKAFATEHAKAK